MNALKEMADRANDLPITCSSTTGRIRLGCRHCDAAFDGIDDVPPGWSEVEEIRSYERAIEPIPDGQDRNKYGDTVVDWETHVGVCPECQEEHTDAAQDAAQ